jgi:formylglycine-generating enzyme required for sulfatase activity
MWTDAEIDDVSQDRFDFRDHARILAARAVKPGPPLTIGIFGPWGSGKSSLMELIKNRLPKETRDGGRVQSIEINAWQLGNQDEVGYAFLQALFSKVQGELPRRRRIDWGKLGRQLASNLYRVVLAITPMVIGVLIAKPEVGWGDVASWLLSPVAGAGTLVTVGLSLWTWVKPLFESARAVVSFDLQAVLKHAPFEAQISELVKLQERFAGMVRTLVGEDGRLIVFIDDLDRCTPNKAPEVLEAIKLFTAVDGCAYVLGLDHEIMVQGLEKRYKYVTKTESTEYLEKIIQIPFHLPPLDFNQVLVFIKKEYPDIADVCDTAPEIFARGVEPNPRKIKRALNIYRMLHQLVDTRWMNYEMDYRVDPELLAKIVVIQTGFPDLYEVLVRDPASIKTLEALAFCDREWFREASQVRPIPAILTWLKEQIRDPKTAKGVEEGLVELGQLGPEAFDVDPSLVRAMKTGSPRSKDLELRELGSYIYLTHKDERFAGQLYPSREEREVLLGGDEEAIKARLEGIERRSPQQEDRDREIAIYTEFLENVVAELERGTPAQRWSANVALDLALDLLKPFLSERKDFEPMTVRIPGGTSWMGSGEEMAIAHYHENDEHAVGDIEKPILEVLYTDECPQHQVHLTGYRIGRFPVTNREYQVFIDKEGHPPPKYWKRGRFPRGKEDHPVVWVGWEDAAAYCAWLTKETGRLYRLPTEAEWEAAARGKDKRIYPWGDDWDPSRLNSKETSEELSILPPASTVRRLWDMIQAVFGPIPGGRTTRVGQFSPRGDSPYGVADMAGNVREWCEDWYDAKAYQDREGKVVSNPQVSKKLEFRVQRSGSFRDDKSQTRCAYRGGGMVLPLRRGLEQLAFQYGLASSPCDHWGFRVVISRKEELLEAWEEFEWEAEEGAAEADTTTEKAE